MSYRRKDENFIGSTNTNCLGGNQINHEVSIFDSLCSRNRSFKPFNSKSTQSVHIILKNNHSADSRSTFSQWFSTSKTNGPLLDKPQGRGPQPLHVILLSVWSGALDWPSSTKHFTHICLCLISRWAERSVEVWTLRCDYYSFAPMSPRGFTLWLCPSLALLCLSALFSTVDMHPANPFPYERYLRVTKMTFVSPLQSLQRQTHCPCIKPDWECVLLCPSSPPHTLCNHSRTGAILNSLAK